MRKSYVISNMKKRVLGTLLSQHKYGLYHVDSGNFDISLFDQYDKSNDIQHG